MSTTDPIQVTNPTDLVALIPALIHVHPDESLVVVALHADRSIAVTVRMDITDDLDAQRESTTQIAKVCAENGATTGVALTFHPDRLAGYGHRAEMQAALHRAGITDTHGMHVDSEQITIDNGGTCPLPTPEQAARVRATVGAAGPIARSEKTAALAPVKDADVTNQVAWLDLETADPANAATDLDALCCLHLATGEIPAKDAARYLLSIAQVAYRDAVSVALAGPDVMPNAREALTDLARRAPRGYAADAYALAALTHYLAGDGIDAIEAVRHAKAAKPGHTLARLIEVSIHQGVAPTVIRDMLATLTAEG